MKEYRIVCTLDQTHSKKYGGGTTHREAATVMIGGCVRRNRTFFDKAEAEAYLQDTIPKAAKYDQKRQAEFNSGDPDTVWTAQSNIRIQCREVSEWEDL